jgi:CRP/FNR family transcriptional regulator, polysaccharide utilization system transcription regulator
MSVNKEYPLDCGACLMRKLSVFNNLRSEDIQCLNHNKNHLEFKKGKIIFAVGQRPLGIYIVYSGKVKVQKLGSNAKEQIVRLAKEGDILGYRSLISGCNYNATAETLEDSVLCFLSKETFFELMKNNPSVSMNLMKLLSDKLGAAETKIVEIIQKPTRNRIAETLLLLNELFGTEEDGQTINVVMTREDIANIAGMSTETAIRLLYDLRDDGLIGLEKKKIKILNIKKLIKESNIED